MYVGIVIIICLRLKHELMLLTNCKYILQVILTSELIGHFWNACLWDMSSGTMLVSYKGGVSAPHTLQVLGEDHLISAQHNKPILNVWSLQKKVTFDIHLFSDQIKI